MSIGSPIDHFTPEAPMHLPIVNIAVMQPAGYLHSQGLVDPARYMRHQLRRLGADVSLTKNRLRDDAVNLVFGAHLGFPAEWTRRFCCIFVNLEQLGDGGAAVTPEYLSLLRDAAVVDYDAENVRAYSAHPDDATIVSLGYAQYLDEQPALPIEQRPIDLLFFGSVNPRREAFIRRIEGCGVQVSLLDRPLYGPERDAFVLQSKAVLNCHFYESARFEQVRAFHCLSLGTPVISERLPHTRATSGFEDAVFWLDDARLEAFFNDVFRGPTFATHGRDKLNAFRALDPIDGYADLLAFASGYRRVFESIRPAEAWRPRRVNLDTRTEYIAGWLNVDTERSSQPDLAIDLSRPQRWPLVVSGERAARVRLEAGSVERVRARHLPQRSADSRMLVTNLLELLCLGGELEVDLPREDMPAVWTDPSNALSADVRAWARFTHAFWQAGWFTHRFEVANTQPLDRNHEPSEFGDPSFYRVTLRKVMTSPFERCVARTFRPDFGEFDEDPLTAIPSNAPAPPPAAATNAPVAPAVARAFGAPIALDHAR